MDRTTRVNLLKNLTKSQEISISTASKLLDVNRTSAYYKKPSPSEKELKRKKLIDKLHTDNPTWGSRQMSEQLKKSGINVGRKLTRRYMAEMDINAIYPKMNLSKRLKQAKACPYLLREAKIEYINQAWSIDITYIPINRGYAYLTAIIDWHSRYIVGWDIDDTLDTQMVIRAVKKGLKLGKPEIINSDQGSQFTSGKYMDFLKEQKIRQSMDGKSRWADNIMIERWFRTLKYDEVYLTSYANLKEARIAIAEYINKYNNLRLHSSLDYQTPAEVYNKVDKVAA